MSSIQTVYMGTKNLPAIATSLRDLFGIPSTVKLLQGRFTFPLDNNDSATISVTTENGSTDISCSKGSSSRESAVFDPSDILVSGTITDSVVLEANAYLPV